MAAKGEEKDVAKMSVEELEQLGEQYGLSNDTSLDLVQLDGLVVLKIIKHCKENLPELVTGQLLGLDVGSTLEVTNCFPFPSRGDASEEEGSGASTASSADSGAEYQIEMMRRLREVNVDYNTVGWYTSTYLGSFLHDESLVHDQFNYQTTINKCVVVVFDPLKINQGELSLKAFRLTNEFMELYKNQDFTYESLIKANLSFNNIFEQLPIRIHNSGLVTAFLSQLEEEEQSSSSISRSSEFDCLGLSTHPYLEKNLEFLIDCVDVLANEQKQAQFYQSALHRQRQIIHKRKMQGEREEDIMATLKPLQQPNRLESLLITNQVNNYCKQINQFSGQSFSKLFMLQGLQPASSSQDLPSTN
ncbi:Eukaryotic translation initiation factor 3 subunit H [Balamuthia mandrillaris]